MFFIADLVKYAATLPNYPGRCVLIDYFNKSNFKDRIVRSLMMVITPKYVGAVLMSILM
jgi:hypothetical protein